MIRSNNPHLQQVGKKQRSRMQRSRETEIPQKCPKRKKIIHHQKPSRNKSKSGLDLGAFNTRRTAQESDQGTNF